MKNLRSIVFLIWITPLISFSQSFDVDKNIFLDNDIIVAKVSDNSSDVKIRIPPDRKDVYNLSKEPLNDSFQNNKFKKYYIYDSTHSERYWDDNNGPSYWTIIEDEKIYYLLISLNSYMFYKYPIDNYDINNTYFSGKKANNGDIEAIERKKYHSTKRGSIGLSNSSLHIINNQSQNDLFSLKHTFLENRINIYIKNYVKNKIDVWQTKDEFEKTSDYRLRVTVSSRKLKAIDLQKEAKKKIINFFVESLKSKYNQIENLDSGFYSLESYDADNETFLMKIKTFPDDEIVVNIPISFARNVKNKKKNVTIKNHEFIINDGKIILTYFDGYLNEKPRSYSYIKKTPDGRKFDFARPKSKNFKKSIPKSEKVFQYDVKNQFKYVNTEIDYNFDPIEIQSDDFDLANDYTKTSSNKISVGKSKVDINIPNNGKVNNRYALVIGNEDYKSMQTNLSSDQNVDYAVNDATIFKNYALSTLGVKEENMHFLTNATLGQMSREIELVNKIVSKIGEKAELIVYYAGHGYPDNQTKAPYLIPVDVSATNLENAIKLDDLYASLASTNASKITVFLDACFTGAGRSEGLLSSRGVKVRPKTGVLSGNIVVFSASSSDQPSLPNHNESHGIFTYHLLKKLQQTKGNVTLGELSNYLEQEVSLQSLKINKTDQEPSVNVSNKVNDNWRNWRF